MPNKQKKYKKTFIITISGYSRAYEGEETFIEGVVSKMVRMFCQAMELSYKTMNLTLEERDDQDTN